MEWSAGTSDFDEAKLDREQAAYRQVVKASQSQDGLIARAVAMTRSGWVPFCSGFCASHREAETDR